MKKSNLVLIGMPGAGKSTAGVLAAKALRKAFIDTDLLIQEKANRLLQDIIDSDGVEKFLKIEEEAILSLRAKNSVVATGGSVVYSLKAIEKLKEEGSLVYLQLRYDEIEKRVDNMKSRGIAIGKGQNLFDLYKERIPLYEKVADITVNGSDCGIDEVVQRIIEELTHVTI